MTFEAMLLSALTAGLFGSLHCAGMCGGIASALGMSLKTNSETTKSFYSALFYQVGRISSYAIAGFIAGSFGDVLNQSELVNDIGIYTRIFSAIFMVGLGFFLAGLFPSFLLVEKMGVPLWKKISTLSKHLLPVKHVHQAYGLGLLWGWLPCGLTYSILLWSLAAGSGTKGALLIFAFGLGTIPAMLPLTLGAGHVTKLTKHPVLRKVVGLLIVAAGSYILIHTVMMAGSRHNHSKIPSKQGQEKIDHSKIHHSDSDPLENHGRCRP